MKKLISLGLLSLLSVFGTMAWADTTVTDCGQLTLTNNQILNWHPSGIWLHFSYVNGEVLAVSSDAPTSQQITDLLRELAALPNTTPQSVYISQFNFNEFWGKLFSSVSPQAYYSLAQYARAIELLWSYPNISGIRPFIQGLVGQTINGYTILQSDMDAVVSAFASQNITI